MKDEAAEQLRRDYENTFSSEHGQRVLRNLLHRFWFMESCFHPDPNVVQFREGQRDVVVDILRNTGERLDTRKTTERMIQAYKDYDPTSET